MVYNVTKVLYSSKNPEEKQTNQQLFLKDHVTQKFSFNITGINYILKYYIQIEMGQNITIFAVFWVK